jgi:hypothetical protein
MRYRRILAFGAVVLLVACAHKPPAGTAPFVPFDAFLKDVRAARYQDYAGRPGVKVRDQAAFEEMRAHIVRMYDGVSPVHTFVVEGQLFDCVPVDTQPSVRLLKLDRVERTPPTGASPGAYAAGKVPGEAKGVESPLVLGLKDPYGNKVSCVAGTFPMARITLDTVTRFTTLNEFFGKAPGVEGVPTDRRGEILPGDGKDHRYATARRSDVTSFGGNSWLNLWTPTGGFTLSQQWYSGGSDAGHQTVEGGWVVYKSKFNSDKPVLFIFFTADNYGTKKCYNVLCEAFVQTNNNWYLGGPWTSYSTTGGAQWGFEMQWKLFRGNWWLFLKGAGSYEAVGYYPTKIFEGGQMSRNATQITYGGETVGPSPWPQMGSGETADKGWQRAAYQRTIFYIPRDEDDGTGVWANLTVIPPDKCYSIDLVPASNGGSWGEYFFFGGPGGDC